MIVIINTKEIEMEEFIITFRESLEVSLVVGIILGYLWKTKMFFLKKYVYIGIFLGLIGSISVAIGFYIFIGGFRGISEVVFEGATMVLTGGMIAYIVILMSGKNSVSAEIRRKVALNFSSYNRLGLVFLVFILILREGVETTLFLSSLLSSQSGISIFSGLAGVFLGLLVGYSVFKGYEGLKLRYVFALSSFFLSFFAVGLFARGVHEFQEIGYLPTFVEQVWNTNFIIAQNSFVGKFLNSLISYNATPSLTEVFVYIGSLMLIFTFYGWRSAILKRHG